MSDWPFGDLKRGHYGAIYADPPWMFERWHRPDPAKGEKFRAAEDHYQTMPLADIAALPVSEIAAPDSALFLWVTWPFMELSLQVVSAWGFQYKTCAFCWTKADARQPHFFQEDTTPYMGLGYWTRANSEPCILATRGKPKRSNADVRQAIVEPKRQHSRKPDGMYDRIERLVAGPYCELFARNKRPGWDSWGNQTEKFREVV